jgi:hypothetical protein
MLGNLKFIEYLYEKKCPWNKWTCASAVGNLECLKYLHEKKCPWDKYTCAYAAGNGHLESLKYAHTHGCIWSEDTCSFAAENGHLEILKYAHENNCPWDKFTSFCAAMNGQLECFKYAVENGCPWDKEECLYYSIQKNHNLIANYIKIVIDSEKKDEDEIFNNEVLFLNCENCKVNKKCVIYEPCNHLLSCWSCAVKTEECSNCKKKISSLLKIFFS